MKIMTELYRFEYMPPEEDMLLSGITSKYAIIRDGCTIGFVVEMDGKWIARKLGGTFRHGLHGVTRMEAVCKLN